LHSTREIDDAWSDSDRDAVFAGILIGAVSRAPTGGWQLLVDGDTVLVAFWVNVAPVADEDITIVEREFECFVLSAF
jgi:sensor histidine kinase regulating citrate/malate metabolism